MLDDMTVPNGAFWVSDEGINVDDDGDGAVAKPATKRRATKKKAARGESDEDDE